MERRDFIYIPYATLCIINHGNLFFHIIFAGIIINDSQRENAKLLMVYS